MWLCTMKWLRYLGRISFGIYVLHFPMMEVIGERSRPILDHFFQKHDLLFFDTTLIHLILFGGLTTLLAHFSYSLYERPMMRFGDLLLGRREVAHGSARRIL